MKTRRDVVLQCLTVDEYIKFIDNVSRENRSEKDFLDWGVMCGDESSSVSSAFNWSETPEGRGYWLTIYNRIHEVYEYRGLCLKKPLTHKFIA